MTAAGLPDLFALLSDRQLAAEYAAVRHDPAKLGMAQGCAGEMRRRGLDPAGAS